jgi:hypothetical protein
MSAPERIQLRRPKHSVTVAPRAFDDQEGPTVRAFIRRLVLRWFPSREVSGS